MSIRAPHPIRCRKFWFYLIAWTLPLTLPLAGYGLAILSRTACEDITVTYLQKHRLGEDRFYILSHCRDSIIICARNRANFGLCDSLLLNDLVTDPEHSYVLLPTNKKAVTVSRGVARYPFVVSVHYSVFYRKTPTPTQKFAISSTQQDLWFVCLPFKQILIMDQNVMPRSKSGRNFLNRKWLPTF